jgi:hypothetical protein
LWKGWGKFRRFLRVKGFFRGFFFKGFLGMFLFRMSYLNMKNFWFCCFKDLEDVEKPEQKSTNVDTELTMTEKLNIVKDLIRKSVEECKSNRFVKRNRPEVVIAIDHIPVYEDVEGQLKIKKNESRKIVYTD